MIIHKINLKVFRQLKLRSHLNFFDLSSREHLRGSHKSISLLEHRGFLVRIIVATLR